jgi:hypothetical protein
MSTVKMAYDTLTTITITLNGLAAGAAREGLALDNTGNVYLDALLRAHLNFAAGTPSDLSRVNFYAAGSVDGTNYTDNATGVDAGLTMRALPNLPLLGWLNVPAGAGAYEAVFGSIAQAFGGVLPAKWSIVVENRSGLALAGSGNAMQYRGLYALNL